MTYQISPEGPGDYGLGASLRDTQARVTRALEALRDGDGHYADQILDDLLADLWREIEQWEHAR